MKYVSVGLIVLMLAVSAPAKPRGPVPTKGGDKVELRDPVELPIKVHRQQAVCLSPDGKTVLFAERNDNRKYAYHTVGVDGKDKKQVFESDCPFNELITCCMGHGVWSPDGMQFAALTIDGGRKDIRMVLCDLKTGKTTPLPRTLDMTVGGAFDTNGSLYYVDCTNPNNGRNRIWTHVLSKYDAGTGKSAEVVRSTGGIPIGLTMSPRRDRIGGLLARRRPRKDDDGPEFHLWAHDLRTGRTAESAAVDVEDSLIRGGWARWDGDGTALYCNTDKSNKGKREHSIARFEPFPGAGKQPTLTLLHEKKAMHVGAAFAPGKLSIAPRRGKKAFVLDVKTDKTVECNLPLFLLDRQRNVGVFRDLRTNKLCTARTILK